MPDHAAEEAASVDISSLPNFENNINTFNSPDMGYDAYNMIKKDIGADPKGFKDLALQLSAALRAREMYAEIGIDDKIFVDTMGCFSRFVKEHMVSFGHYGFDRGWWTWHQLCLSIFRIGVLEYEKKIDDGKNVLSIHIPSDSAMTREALDASYNMAAEFFKNKFKDYKFEYAYTDTWLLSPALRDMLPAGSKILDFMSDYKIVSSDPDAMDFFTWVFKIKHDDTVDYTTLPENTSLQRTVKKHLVAGGKIGNAKGILYKTNLAENGSCS